MSGIERRNAGLKMNIITCSSFQHFDIHFKVMLLRPQNILWGLLIVIIQIHRFINKRRNDIVATPSLLLVECVIFTHLSKPLKDFFNDIVFSTTVYSIDNEYILVLYIRFIPRYFVFLCYYK